MMYYITSNHPLGFMFGPVYEFPQVGYMILRKAEFDTGTSRWIYDFMVPPQQPVIP